MNLAYCGKLREARKQVDPYVEAARHNQSEGDITRLEVIRAMTEMEFGNVPEARKAADPDIPVLIQAKAEFEKVKQYFKTLLLFKVAKSGSGVWKEIAAAGKEKTQEARHLLLTFSSTVCLPSKRFFTSEIRPSTQNAATSLSG